MEDFLLSNSLERKEKFFNILKSIFLTYSNSIKPTPEIFSIKLDRLTIISSNNSPSPVHKFNFSAYQVRLFITHAINTVVLMHKIELVIYIGL